MAWQSMRLVVDGDRAEAWADALLEAGALSVSIEDRDLGTQTEEPQFGEPGMADPRAWKHNWVVALLSAETDPDVLLALAGIPQDTPRQFETVEEQDWVRLTQSQFDPIPISERLWIVPSWHDAPDLDAICIELDPGLAFGTGSHPTTRLCLRWLEAHVQPGVSVLDYGCGSGILAIAAKKLGAGTVTGVDLDSQAVEASRDNAQCNGVEAEFSLPGLADQGPVDVLVANILTNPLKALMPLLASKVRPGGRIALSGILDSQADEVIGLYSATFDIDLWAVEEGWVCLSGVRRC